MSLAFYTALMLIYKYVTVFEPLNLIFTLICNIFCIFVCFKSTLKSALFHGLSLTLSQFISEVASVYIISQIQNTPADLYRSDITVYAVNVVVSKLFYLLICRLLLKNSNKESANRAWGRWFSLSILPISSIFIIIVIRTLTSDLRLTVTQNAVYVSSLIALLVANIVVYYIYERAEKSSQKLTQLELENQKNEIDMQHLELLEIKNEKMNILAHDYKNHLLTIKDMCDSTEVSEYIDKMIGDISKQTSIAKSKNKLLDVILNKYSDMCQEKGIRFEVNMSSDNLSFIYNYDISSLFNNILDNAYEAALMSSEKYIYLEISKALGSYHRIIARNSSDIKPLSREGKLVSTKKNKDSHGFGTKSIKKVVSKYHGELQWEYDEEMKEFKLTVVFPEAVK